MFDQLDIRIWNTTRCPQRLDFRRGLQRMRFNIGPLLLNDGDYYWNFNATCQGSIEHIIWFMHAGRFTVTSEFRPLGNIPYIVDTSHCELVMLSPESLPSSQQAWQSFK